MKVETLKELEAAFESWRRRKRHVREPVPLDLRQRAQQAVGTYGLGAVAKATKIEGSRLKADCGRRARADVTVPSYSRMELALPAHGGTERPLAEVETPAGLRVRIFTPAPEAVGLVASLLGMGGARCSR